MVTPPQESKEIAPITTDVQEPPGGSTTSPPTAGETVPVAVTAESAEAGPSAGPSATAQHINPVVTAGTNTDNEDTDSAYGDDDQISDTTSISSAIWKHRYENGRRYHVFREGEYWGPNDELQNDQLDIAHHMFLILLDQKLHLAPVKNLKRILDLGCGTGIWCMDMADEHPGAEVIGVDLSPIQPSFTPPNCKFEIDDVTSVWTYPAAHFDFINIRTLYGSIADWPALYAQIFNGLEPGGYFHQLELSVRFKSDDGSLTPDHTLSQWSDVFSEASEKFGKSFNEVWNMSRYIRNQGFQDVVEKVYKVPVNGWPADPHMKELGRWNFLHITQGAEGWGLFLLTKVMGWTALEAQVFIAKFRNSLKERKVHAYLEVVVIHAHRPRA